MRSHAKRALEVPAQRCDGYTITAFFIQICEEIAMTSKIRTGLRASTVCMFADGALH